LFSTGQKELNLSFEELGLGVIDSNSLDKRRKYPWGEQLRYSQSVWPLCFY